MIGTIVSGGFKAVLWSLAVAGFAALLLGGLIAWPVRQPPELTSISEARKTIDYSALPDLTRFQARDGTELAYRHYSAQGPATGRIAVVVHGSSGSSRGAVHALSFALAARGVQTYAVDIRGHGASGTRGDIAYLGQLEDDMVDLVAEIRKSNPDAPLTLIGHSSGGGFALRVAASPIQNLFTRTVLLAPYLGYDAPSSRPEFRRLGQSRYSALYRAVGAASPRISLGGVAAGDSVRSAAEFERQADVDLFVPADAQFCSARFPRRPSGRDQTAHDHFRRCRRIDQLRQIP